MFYVQMVSQLSPALSYIDQPKAIHRPIPFDQVNTHIDIYIDNDDDYVMLFTRYG